jgi:mono/diheme cytochrome c family protein
MQKQSVAIGIVGGIVGTLLVAVAIWLTVVYTGAYNVAASDQHADAVRWTLDTTMHRSVASRAGAIAMPEEPSEQLIAEGAGHYAESCAHCHGAPGAEPAEWSRGMRPEPPHLVEAASEWTPQEIHWIVTNGIKMSGMPAFGSHHSPQEIVALAAFVTALPGLAADDYAVLTTSGEPAGPEGR